MRPTILRLLALAALISSTAPPVAHAGFIDSRKDWAAMSEGQKRGYAMGLFDRTVGTYFLGSESQIQQVLDEEECAIYLELNSQDLVDLIDNAYLRPEMWEIHPWIVFSQQLRTVCTRRINARRALRGQEPLAE